MRLSLPIVLCFPLLAVAAPATMPTLRTGERKVVEHAEPLKVEVTGRSLDGMDELLQLTVELPDGAANVLAVDAATTGGAAAFALFTQGRLWVRRAARDAGRPLEGHLYCGAEWELAEPAHHLRFTAPAAATGAADEKLRRQFGDAVARELGGRAHLAPFYAYATDALRARYAPTPIARDARRAPPRRLRGDELQRLMGTTTGMTSIQEAIQADRPLWIQTAKEKAILPIASLKGPPLAQHPFDAMLRALKRPAPPERLAAATPAEFWYARLDDLSVFFRIVDQLDAWATPAVNVLEGHGADHALAERALTQLGLERGPLARALGTQVVAELAVVGSDPYVREGTDLTVIFRVKQKTLFDAALAGGLASHLRAHGGGAETKIDHQGTEVRVQRSADGAVRQHRAQAGELEIVSNSLAATRRVLDAIGGRVARLADEPDLRYLLARDAGEHADGFVFLGDRFIAEVVGPRQKILESRRQLALAELLVPGYAALLFGWLEGRVPASTEELLGGGWLKREDLRHAPDNAEIAFTPAGGARSRWGTPAALEPLLDAPTPRFVTPSEKTAYEAFALGYQQYWRQYMDPIAVRFTFGRAGAATGQLTVDVRVLPLIDGTDYHKIEETVGRARLTTPPVAAGLRAVLGVGADAELRREVAHLAGSNPFGQRIALDWLGEWILFGVEDRPEIAHTLLAVEPRAVPQAPAAARERAPWSRQFEVALRTPVYLAIGVRNLLGATLFLGAAKKLVGDAAPGIVSWAEGAPYKGTRIVHVSVAPRSLDRSAPGADLFYALGDEALLVTLHEDVLRHLIDERAGGKGTQPVDRQDGSTQLAVEWASGKGSPLQQVFGWLLEAATLEQMAESRARAEALLRGAPGAPLRATGLLYEGAAPLPADGGAYTLAHDGVRDPARGSPALPRWPTMPVAGSPVERLLGAVARFRGEVAFDDEPAVEGHTGMRSLHARVTLGLR